MTLVKEVSLRMTQTSDRTDYNGAESVRDEFDDCWHGLIFEMVGRGKAPRVVAASIEYVDTTQTQWECALNWGTTEASVSNTYPEVLDYADKKEIRVIKTRPPTSRPDETEAKIIEDIAEILGWENSEDGEYEFEASDRVRGPNIKIRKDAFRSIRDALLEVEA